MIHCANHSLGSITTGKFTRKIRQKAGWSWNRVFVSSLSKWQWPNKAEWRWNKQLLGPGVLLTLGPDPANGSYSITSRVAYWAGRIDATEWGEPSTIPIRSLNELSTAITKAACTQAVHKHESYDIPISATSDYAMLKPLLREAPAVLKRYLIANWDEIKRDTEHNEGLGDNDPCNQLPTWKELIHDIVNRACEMG